MTEAHDKGLIVVTDPLTWVNRTLILDLVARSHLPAMFYNREYVELGGLMSYGPSGLDQFRRAANYVDTH
jgi:putative ABC transport system substrate-binding protein